MGVKTIIDLGLYIWECDNLNDPAVQYEHIPFYTYIVRDDQVLRFLRILADPASGKTYVHCRLAPTAPGS